MKNRDLDKISSITVKVSPEDFIKKMNQELLKCFGVGLLLEERKTLSKELFDRLYNQVYCGMKESMLFTHNTFINDESPDTAKMIVIMGKVTYEDFINYGSDSNEYGNIV